MASQELFLREDMQQLWQGRDAFAAARAVSGTIFRKLEQRQTLAFSHANHCYFIKRHRGVPLQELLRNLLQLRLPVTSARNEYLAIRQLQQLGIKVPTVAAYGRRGLWPSSSESFLVTDDVGEHVSLAEHCRHWALFKPQFGHKLELLLQIADIARAMHGAGMVHRDFCLGHLLLSGNGSPLTVVDLHRALIKPSLSRGWKIKDLAGLYCSALECGLTGRDLLRFIKRYSSLPLRQILGNESGFWPAVASRARRLYFQQQREKPQPLAY